MQPSWLFVATLLFLPLGEAFSLWLYNWVFDNQVDRLEQLLPKNDGSSYVALTAPMTEEDYVLSRVAEYSGHSMPLTSVVQAPRKHVSFHKQYRYDVVPAALSESQVRDDLALFMHFRGNTTALNFHFALNACFVPDSSVGTATKTSRPHQPSTQVIVVRY